MKLSETQIIRRNVAYGIRAGSNKIEVESSASFMEIFLVPVEEMD